MCLDLRDASSAERSDFLVEIYDEAGCQMKDIRGMLFGKLTAVEPLEKRANGKVVWMCRCSCGGTTEVSSSHLNSGHTTSCGCKHLGVSVGKAYGKLTAIELVGRNRWGDAIWSCRCSCGRLRELPGGKLVSGHTTSCGCNRPGVSPGQTYGKLTVISATEKRANGKVVWLCRCSCGKTKDVSGSHLISGDVTSCGCKHFGILIGQTYGELTAIGSLDKKTKNGGSIYLCRCSCGRTTEVRGSNLKSGHVTSCGHKTNFFYDGIRFRSKWEIYWYMAATIRGIPVEYEKHVLDVLILGKMRHFTPDFWLPEVSEFVEIKGRRRKDAMDKIDQARRNGHIINLVDQYEQIDDWCGRRVSVLNKAY